MIKLVRKFVRINYPIWIISNITIITFVLVLLLMDCVLHGLKSSWKRLYQNIIPLVNEWPEKMSRSYFRKQKRSEYLDSLDDL